MRQPGGQRPAHVEQRLLAQAERAQDGGRDLRGIADRGQLHQPHAVWHRGQLGPRRLGGQPGLARAARTGERDQAVSAEEPGDLAEFGVAADEAGELGAQVGVFGAAVAVGGAFGVVADGMGCGGLGCGGLGCGGLGCGGLAGVGAEDFQVQRRQLRRRLDA